MGGIKTQGWSDRQAGRKAGRAEEADVSGAGGRASEFAGSQAVLSGGGVRVGIKQGRAGDCKARCDRAGSPIDGSGGEPCTWAMGPEPNLTVPSLG